VGQSEPGPHLDRAITLSGATALVVGGVIGAGIFALVAPIVANAGAATWIAFLIALAVSITGAVPVVQLASTLPRAGAGYFFASRLLTPMSGTLASWWILFGGACSSCVVSTAFASYVLAAYGPPGLPGYTVGLFAITIVIAFYVVYLFGVRLAMGIQIVFAIQMLLALGAYAILGAARVDITIGFNAPLGVSAFFMAVVICYNTCIGFTVLAEMAEEIRDPHRTIPLAIFLGGGVVAVVYILIGAVFWGSVTQDSEAILAMEAPLIQSARTFMGSEWWIHWLNIGAITAGLTSLNAAAVSLPREIFAQARDVILPTGAARIDARTRTPLAAVTIYIAFVLVLLITGIVFKFSIDFYSYLTVVGIQVANSIICLASLSLSRRFPEEFNQGYIRFPLWILLLCTIVTVLASAGLFVLMAMEEPAVVWIYAVLTIIGITYHHYRVRALRRRGVPFDEHVRAIPESGSGASFM